MKYTTVKLLKLVSFASFNNLYLSGYWKKKLKF